MLGLELSVNFDSFPDELIVSQSLENFCIMTHNPWLRRAKYMTRKLVEFNKGSTSRHFNSTWYFIGANISCDDPQSRFRYSMAILKTEKRWIPLSKSVKKFYSQHLAPSAERSRDITLSIRIYIFRFCFLAQWKIWLFVLISQFDKLFIRC